MFWRLVSLLGIPDLLEHLAGRLGFSAACPSIGSDRHLPIRACCVRSTTKAKFSEFSVWQCDSVIYFFRSTSRSSEFIWICLICLRLGYPSMKPEICPTHHGDYIVLHDVFAGILPSRLFSRPQMVLGLMIGFTGFVSQIAMTKGMQKAPVVFFELFFKNWQGMGRNGWNDWRKMKWKWEIIWWYMKILWRYNMNREAGLGESKLLWFWREHFRRSRRQLRWYGRAYVPFSPWHGKPSSFLQMSWVGRVSQVPWGTDNINIMKSQQTLEL